MKINLTVLEGITRQHEILLVCSSEEAADVMGYILAREKRRAIVAQAIAAPASKHVGRHDSSCKGLRATDARVAAMRRDRKAGMTWEQIRRKYHHCPACITGAVTGRLPHRPPVEGA